MICNLDLEFRNTNGMKPIFVFNLHIQDRPSSAREGAKSALRLAELVVSNLFSPPSLQTGS